MALKVFLRKLKVIKWRKFVTRAIEGKGSPKKKQPSWMGVSHGYHVVEKGGISSEGSVVVQREQMGASEVWLFGAFDQQMGDGVTKYLQSQLFEKKLSEHQIVRKGKQAMKAAYVSTRARLQPPPQETSGAASVLAVDGERFVAADAGGYRAVVCKAGTATQIGRRRQGTDGGHWSLSTISEKLFGHRVGDEDHNKRRNSRVVVVAERVESETEFIILASDGVWEVLRNQEAVDLIRHMEDAQEAAECLAKEALTRMTKSTVSCIVIRFD